MADITDLVALSRLRVMARSGEARRIRVMSGLSQPEMARAVGVSPAAISRWESGARRPSSTAGSRYLGLIDALERQLCTSA